MPFRTKLKKMLSTDAPPKPVKAIDQGPNHSYYAEGEVVPQSKYRRPVPQEHKDKLEAFSFSTAWRRHSSAARSTVGPHGETASRGNSVVSLFRRKSSAKRGDSVAPDEKVDAGTAAGAADANAATKEGAKEKQMHPLNEEIEPASPALRGGEAAGATAAADPAPAAAPVLANGGNALPTITTTTTAEPNVPLDLKEEPKVNGTATQPANPGVEVEAS